MQDAYEKSKTYQGIKKSARLSKLRDGKEIANKSWFFCKYMESRKVVAPECQHASVWQGMEMAVDVSISQFYYVEDFDAYAIRVDELRKYQKFNRNPKPRRTDAVAQSRIDDLENNIKELNLKHLSVLRKNLFLEDRINQIEDHLTSSNSNESRLFVRSIRN